MFCGLCGSLLCLCSFFFFNDTATTEIYTLSLHDALPILGEGPDHLLGHLQGRLPADLLAQDRKSTRLNSSHTVISYAVFCLKKQKIHSLENTWTNGYSMPIEVRYTQNTF